LQIVVHGSAYQGMLELERQASLEDRDGGERVCRLRCLKLVEFGQCCQQIRLDGAGRILSRDSTRLPFGGAVFLTEEAEGDTVHRSEAGVAFVRQDGSLPPTIRSTRPRIRPVIRRDRLRTIRRRRALRVRFRPGVRGLALVTARARGRTIARTCRSGPAARRPAGCGSPRPGVACGSTRRLRVRASVTRNDMAGNLLRGDEGDTAALATPRPLVRLGRRAPSDPKPRNRRPSRRASASRQIAAVTAGAEITLARDDVEASGPAAAAQLHCSDNQASQSHSRDDCLGG
jgi:hypothetical protein